MADNPIKMLITNVGTIGIASWWRRVHGPLVWKILARSQTRARDRHTDSTHSPEQGRTAVIFMNIPLGYGFRLLNSTMSASPFPTAA